MPIPSDNIVVSKITESLDAAIQEINATYLKVKKISNLGWMNILLEHLSKAGKDLRYDVSPDIGTVNPSWLYDLMWKGSRSGNETLLVVECVWSKVYLEIKDDFAKLLMANAQLRLLITYGGDNDKDKERALGIIERLKKNIESGGLSEAGEQFLFATIVKDNAYRFHYEFVEKA